jgi:hypothetical protein
MKSLSLLALASLASLALVAGCDKKSEASPPSSAAQPASAPAEDAAYALSTDAPECKAGATCTATLRLEAKGDFHLNDEYPFKFTAGDNAKVEYLGTDGGGKNVFSKAAGDFAKQTAKVGVMTVKFKPSAPGSVTIDGVYKLSVCSEATCKLDNPSAKVTVAVK